MAEMEIARNDTVVGPGDVEVGRIEHVIVDGPSGRVAELVVARRDGTEFTLPISNVRQQGPGVFMMHTAPEVTAHAHPFEASDYHVVEGEGDDTDRVVVPLPGTPVPSPASPMGGGVPHRDVPGAGAFVPSPAPTTAMSVPPPPARPLSPPVQHQFPPPAPHQPPQPAQPPPVPRLDHPPEMPPPRIPSAPTGYRAEATQPEPAVAAIAATRTEMRGTVDSLQGKVAPEGAKDRLADAVHEQVAAVKTQVTDAVHEQIATTKEQLHDLTIGQVETTVGHARDTAQGAASDLVGMIRANPVAAALLGLGIGWLWREHRRSSSEATETYRYGYAPQGRPMAPAYGGSRGDWDTALVIEHDDDSLGEKVGDAAAHAKDAVGRVAEQTQERASHLASQAGETVGDIAGAAQERVGDLTHGVQRTAGGLGSDLAAMIRANPIPAALTGAGIGWLLLNRSHGAGDDDLPVYRGGSAASMDRGRSFSPGTYGTAPKPADNGEGVIDALGDAASAAKAKAGRVAERAGDGASDLAETAQERVRDLSDEVQYRALVTQSWWERTLAENPTNIGVVALSLGIAAGCLLPKTRTEDALFGGARDALLGQATEGVQKAQKLARDVQKVVADIEEIQPAPAKK